MKLLHNPQSLLFNAAALLVGLLIFVSLPFPQEFDHAWEADCKTSWWLIPFIF